MEAKKMTCAILIAAASMSAALASDPEAPAPGPTSGSAVAIPAIGSLVGASIFTLLAYYLHPTHPPPPPTRNNPLLPQDLLRTNYLAAENPTQRLFTEEDGTHRLQIFYHVTKSSPSSSAINSHNLDCIEKYLGLRFSHTQIIDKLLLPNHDREVYKIARKIEGRKGWNSRGGKIEEGKEKKEEEQRNGDLGLEEFPILKCKACFWGFAGKCGLEEGANGFWKRKH
ncbi:hypothetical protein FEM48_Zijuj02G0197900 [Ziziphus jujuba var. spinosa]|uniref:Uncharacterized protein n=1 Tax=Ziziphus jujuba var. spinosa TaxID=714518 RepID=A0A978VXM5_ZIZJJ|nr:hypothetical protein FEM48_Zijuj02G0197900 [Ziziphus jujuba var. spinosa]